MAPNSPPGKADVGRAAFHASLFSLWSYVLFDILSWVLSAVQGENLEPISVTAVCLRAAVIDLLCVSVKNLIFGNTLL